MSISYHYNQNQQLLQIAVTGPLNFSKVELFRNIYNQIETVEQIEVNLEATDIIDSSGLGILLYLKRHYKCGKGSVKLLNCNHTVGKTFNMAQFQKLFSFS